LIFELLCLLFVSVITDGSFYWRVFIVILNTDQPTTVVLTADNVLPYVLLCYNGSPVLD